LTNWKVLGWFKNSDWCYCQHLYLFIDYKQNNDESSLYDENCLRSYIELRNLNFIDINSQSTYMNEFDYNYDYDYN
jgi:hypothetical protein